MKFKIKTNEWLGTTMVTVSLIGLWYYEFVTTLFMLAFVFGAGAMILRGNK